MISRTPRETMRIGSSFSKKLSPGNWVGLFGPLGSGKTTFVQGMAQGLGIDPKHYVGSPTFTLVNIYEGKSLNLVHVDLYRIERPEELSDLGLEDYGDEIVVVEWAEKFYRPFNHEVRFRELRAQIREIEILT
jgi:tRNA threonylcarbamoyladenosine biosynthesis protein TsaE